MTQPTQVVFAIASASSEALSKSVDVEVSVDVDVVAVDVAVEVKVEVEVTYKTGWLVVELTPLKNMSQIGLFQPSFGMKIKTYLKPPHQKKIWFFLAACPPWEKENHRLKSCAFFGWEICEFPGG